MNAPTPGGVAEPPAGSATDAPTGDLAAQNVPVGNRTVQQFLTDVGLFFAAPFITMAYLVLFPFIGLAMLLRSGRPPRRRSSAARS